LILMGRNGSPIETSLQEIGGRLDLRTKVKADLEKFSMGTPAEFFGAFVSSHKGLEMATQKSRALTDDRPSMEYVVPFGMIHESQVPAEIFHLNEIANWCPSCAGNEKKSKISKQISSYLRVLESWYMSDNFRNYSQFRPVPNFSASVSDPDGSYRNSIESSPYLTSIFKN
jgi:hypothetical protein